MDTLTLKLPYNLTVDRLVPEPDTSRSSTFEELRRLSPDRWRYNEDELRRIILSAALLLDVHPSITVGCALHTAVIWERG